MMSAETIHDEAGLGPIEREWDDLAVTLRTPYCSPLWMLPWWRHMGDRGGELRIVTVRDGDRLVGVAPFFAVRRGGLVHYRVLASDFAFPVGPLAEPGHEDAVARAVTLALSHDTPQPHIISLDGSFTTPTWSRLLARAWPSTPHPREHRGRTLPAPALDLRGRNYDEWLASKSPNFRQQMRRSRRRLERKGVGFRLATEPEDVDRGLAAFVALHRARWHTRGGSNLDRVGVEEVLRSAAAELADTSRFRLWMLEAEGTIVSTQVFIAAGGEVAYWNGGFDPAWGKEHPALQTILAAIEHAFAVGDRRVSLGGGAQAYKDRFADVEDQLEWTALLPVTTRYPLARLSLVPADARRTISKHLSDDAKQRFRRFNPRVRSADHTPT